MSRQGLLLCSTLQVKKLFEMLVDVVKDVVNKEDVLKDARRC